MRTFITAFDDELEKLAAFAQETAVEARPDMASSVSGFMNRSQGEQAKQGLKMPAAPTPSAIKPAAPQPLTTPNRMVTG